MTFKWKAATAAATMMTAALLAGTAMAEPKVLASRYTSSSTPYQMFVASPLKSFFKALFL